MSEEAIMQNRISRRVSNPDLQFSVRERKMYYIGFIILEWMSKNRCGYFLLPISSTQNTFPQILLLNFV